MLSLPKYFKLPREKKKKKEKKIQAEEKGRCNYTLLKEHFTGLLRCNNNQAYYTKIP